MGLYTWAQYTPTVLSERPGKSVQQINCAAFSTHSFWSIKEFQPLSSRHSAWIWLECACKKATQVITIAQWGSVGSVLGPTSWRQRHECCLPLQQVQTPISTSTGTKSFPSYMLLPPRKLSQEMQVLWCISIDSPATMFSAEHPCCWTTACCKTVNLHHNQYCRSRRVCPLKLACIGASLWLMTGSERIYVRGLWHSWGYQEFGPLTSCVWAKADWYCLENDRAALSLVLPMGFELVLQVWWLKQLTENNGDQ